MAFSPSKAEKRMFRHAGRGFSEVSVYQEKGATWGKGAETLVHTQGWPAGIPSSAAALAVPGDGWFASPCLSLLFWEMGAVLLNPFAELSESGAEPMSVAGVRDRAEAALVLFWEHLRIWMSTCENEAEKEQCSSAVGVLRVAASRCLAEEFLFSPCVGSLAEMLLPWVSPLPSQLPGEQGPAGSVFCTGWSLVGFYLFLRPAHG